MKIGLFGGNFNPIHYGHLRVAEEAREFYCLDKVIFIPSGIHPLKSSNFIEGLHRLKMIEFAVMDNPFFEVSDFEIKLNQPSYTLNTIIHFKKLYEGHILLFIIGFDSFLELPVWYKPEELLKMIDFIVVSRPGIGDCRKRLEEFYFIENKISDDIFKIKNSDRMVYYLDIVPNYVSSSIIRDLIRAKKSIRYLVPEKVRDYIYEHKLYQERNR